MLHLWWTCSICDEHVQFMMNMLCLLDQKLEITFSMSADVYSDLTIGLALKNYHKMGLKLPKSIHWFKRYSEINFYVSWCVQWPHCWIALKTTQWLLNCQNQSTALNKTFMESDGIGQLSRFHCIINYGTQIVSLKKSQSATNIWNFPWAWKFTQNAN